MCWWRVPWSFWYTVHTDIISEIIQAWLWRFQSINQSINQSQYISTVPSITSSSDVHHGKD